jgi:fibronectin type 3 domain-containing protein
VNFNLLVSPMVQRSRFKRFVLNLLPLFLLVFTLFMTASSVRAQSQPPAAPTLSATAGWRQARLNWTHGNESTVDDYLVYRSASSGGAYTLIAQNILAPTKTYLNTGLTDNTTYYYRVTARNSYGESDPSNIASVTLAVDNTLPEVNLTTPANGSRHSTGSIDTISGTVSDELGGSDVNRVNVWLYRYAEWPAQNFEYWNGSQWVAPTPAVATLTTTLTRNTSITTSQAYDWASDIASPSGADLRTGWHAIALFAYDNKGNVRTRTMTFMVGTDVTPPQMTITVPAVPAGAGPLDFIELTSLSEIAGTCVDPPGASGADVTGMHRLQLHLSRVVGGVTEYWNGTAWSAGGPTLTQFLATNATTWSIVGNLPSGVQLPLGDYKIEARVVDRTTLTSAYITRNIRIVAPGTPTNLVAIGRDASVKLAWTAGAHASSYTVKRSLTTGGTFSPIATGVTSTEYINTGLTNSTTYYYKVSAVAPTGESSDSNEAYATPVLDVTNPTVSFVTPVANTRFLTSSLGTISGTATDELAGSGVQSVVLRISRLNVGVTERWNGSAWISNVTNLTTIVTPDPSVTTARGYQWTCNASLPSGADLPPMRYQIQAIVSDARNNQTNVLINVYVGSDVTPPITTITSPAPNAELVTLTGISGTCVDPAVPVGNDVSGMDRVNVSLRKRVGGVNTDYWNTSASIWQSVAYTEVMYVSPSATNWTYSGNLPSGANLPLGDYQLEIRGYDRMLNNETLHQQYFKVVALTDPTNLTAVGGDASIWLAWGASSHAATYNIKRSIDSGVTYTTLATGVTATTYTDTGLTNGTTYYYKVSAVAPTLESADSNEAHATPVLDVTNPTVSFVTPAANTRFSTSSLGTISGTATDELAGSGVQSVVLRISRLNVGVTERWNGSAWISNVTNLTTIVTPDPSVTTARGYQWTCNASLPSGADLPPMRYQIQAIVSDARNNQTNVLINVYVGSDVTPPITTITSPAPNAELVTLTGISGTCVDPAVPVGNDVSGMDRVNVSLRKRVGGVNTDYWNTSASIWQSVAYTEVMYVSPSATNWTYSGNLPSGANLPLGDYQLEIRGYDRTINNETLHQQYFKVVAPAAPANLKAVGGDGAVQLNWDAVPHAIGYKVKRSTTSGGTYTEIASNVTTNSYLDTAVTNGTTYYYKVSAFTGGDGPDSDVVSATPYNFPQPDASIQQKDNSVFVGSTIYNTTGVNQSVTQVLLPQTTISYVVKIVNAGSVQGRFKVKSKLASNDGWTINFYDGEVASTEKNITTQVTGTGWDIVQSPGEGAARKILISMTPDQTASGTSVRELAIEVGPAVAGVGTLKKDVVKALAAVQKLAALEWSVDHTSWTLASGANGTPIPAVNQLAVVGLRVVRSNPDFPWPGNPFKPTWTVDGLGNTATKHDGDTIWVHCPVVGGAETGSMQVLVECGNQMSTAISVKPMAQVTIYTGKSTLVVGGGSEGQMTVKARATDVYGQPIAGKSVKFAALYENSSSAGSWSVGGILGDVAVTDSSGYAQITLTSGVQPGLVNITGTLLDSANQTIAISPAGKVEFVAAL